MNRLRKLQPALEQLEDRIALAYNDFNSIVMFYNLEDPAGTENVSGYSSTSVADVREWMQLDADLTTSEFSQNYWQELSYGQFDFRMEPNRNQLAEIELPTISVTDGTDFYGEIGPKLVEQNAFASWFVSGRLVEDGRRVIPSVVVVHNYGNGATARFQWNHTFTSDGHDYLVGDIFHIKYDTSQFNSVDNPGIPYAWGMPRTWDTVAHEYAHNFLEGGDLYGGSGGKIAYWDLLGDASLPGKMSDTSSYFKERVGWIDFREVISGPVEARQEYRLRSFGDTGDAIKIVPDPISNPEEFFLLEYRQEADTPSTWTPNGNLADSGLLITHMNEKAVETGSRVGQIAPLADVEEADEADGKCWSPGDFSRTTCDSPWSDARRNLSTDPEYVGDSANPFNNWPDALRPESGVLFPNGSNNSFTPFTEPSSDFYGDRKSGLYVTNIREVGNEIAFDVELRGVHNSYRRMTDNDEYFSGDFTGDGKDEILIFDGRELILAELEQNQLHIFWRTDLGSFDEWNFSSDDEIVVGDFNGDGRSDVVLHNTEHLRLLRSTGRSLQTTWTAFDRVGEWNLGTQDKVYAADLNGDGADDLFVRSPQWAGFLRSNGDEFVSDVVINNWIGGWRLNPTDEHFVGDFDGNGTDDIFVRSPEWAGILEYDHGTFENRWIANDRIGNWKLNPGDSHFVGDFDGDLRDDIFIRSPQWAGLLLGNATGLANVWITGEPSEGRNRIDGWRLAGHDRHAIGDFTGDGRDDIYIRSPGYAGILRSEGDHFREEWIASDSIGPWGFKSDDREIIGRFNSDSYHDVFTYRDRNASVLLGYRRVNATEPDATWLQHAWKSTYLEGKARPGLIERTDLHDQRFLGNFSGSGLDDVLVFNGETITLYENQGGEFERVWNSRVRVGEWLVGALNRLHFGDFNGDGFDDIFIRSDHWAGLLLATGTGFSNAWITGNPDTGGDRIGGWRLGPNDRHYVGDFTGDGLDDVFIRSSQWAGLLRSNGDSFEEIWITGDPEDGLNRIGNWRLGPQDQHFVGDFNADGKQDIFVRSPQWAGLLLSDGTKLNNVWITGDPDDGLNRIENWRLGPRDRHSVGDFDGDGTDDIFIRSTQWAGLLTGTGSGFVNTWITGNPAASLNKIGAWQLGALDQEYIGDFNRDGRDDVFIRNADTAGILTSLGSSFASEFIESNQLENWILTAEDEAGIGRFCSIERDEVFLQHPGGWTAAFTPEASATQLQGILAQFYQLTAGAPSGIQDYACDDIDDVGEGISHAYDTPSVSAYSGVIDHDGDSDWFRFFMPAGTRFNVATELNTLPDSTLRLYDRSGVELAFDDDSGAGKASKITWRSTESAYLYVAVSGMDIEQLGTYEFSVGLAPLVPEDFNADGRSDVSDLEMLVADLVSNNGSQGLDLDNDGFISERDLSIWLEEAGRANSHLTGGQPFLRGDADLDGRIDASDLNKLAVNWQSNNSLRWQDGNFRPSGGIDSQDLNALAINWQVNLNPNAAAAVVTVQRVPRAPLASRSEVTQEFSMQTKTPALPTSENTVSKDSAFATVDFAKCGRRQSERMVRRRAESRPDDSLRSHVVDLLMVELGMNQDVNSQR